MNTPVNLVIFASREDLATITRTLLSAISAVPHSSIIDIIVNGNLHLAEAIHSFCSHGIAGESKQVNVWQIATADKANAWNQHIHDIWRGDIDSIYIDGYVRIEKNSISSISRTLSSSQSVIGTSGVPTAGVSAKQQRLKIKKHGGFHGNLCAIKASALSEIRRRKIHIPNGMYRVDSTMGAFLSFGLDNTINEWSPSTFIPFTAEASWELDKRKWYRFKDIIAWHHRRRRQARGDIENAAIKFHLNNMQLLPESLPKDIRSLVINWGSRCPRDSRRIVNSSRRHYRAFQYILAYEIPAKSTMIARQISSC